LICAELTVGSTEVLWLVKRNHPDIMRTRINLPGINRFEFLESIQETNYDPEIIFTSAHTENDFSLTIDISMVGMKRLMAKLDQKT
jgi:two-component SAPR family response regulator